MPLGAYFLKSFQDTKLSHSIPCCLVLTLHLGRLRHRKTEQMSLKNVWTGEDKDLGLEQGALMLNSVLQNRMDITSSLVVPDGSSIMSF